MRVDPRQFRLALVHHIDSLDAWRRHRSRHFYSSRPRPKMPDDLGVMLLSIAEGIVSRPNFSGYSFSGDLVCESLLAMSKAVEKWDCLGPENPFAYFHRVGWNTILKAIQREGKHSRLADLLRAEMTSRISMVDAASLRGQPDDDDGFPSPSPHDGQPPSSESARLSIAV